MDEIKKIRVLVLGAGDYPLADVTVNDAQVLAGWQKLIEREAAQAVRLTPATTVMVRAVARAGVATLQRVLIRGFMAVLDDGRLQAKVAKPYGRVAASEAQNEVL